MNLEFEKKSVRHVLISPLDWGLGHTTRCIPVIKALLQADCTVFVACHATAKKLLQKEFTNLHFLHLEGYSIRYASFKRWFAFKILQQIPKIILAIRREHKWLNKIVAEHQIDLVISDNRYGMFHKNIHSVFITHQLYVQTPFRGLTHLVRYINYRFINRFAECWVPDYRENVNIAGKLSHPKKLPSISTTYIGPLARLFNKTGEIKYRWLILISGPEPQRTVFENLILQNVPFISGTVLLVRGLPDAETQLNVPQHCTVFNHLGTKDMQAAFSQSEYIISRSGYTTIMEIMAAQKKAVLLPTPGQTEQEYLARHLMKQHWCYSCLQHDNLLHHLQLAQQFQYQLPALPAVSLQKTIHHTLEKAVT